MIDRPTFDKVIAKSSKPIDYHKFRCKSQKHHRERKAREVLRLNFFSVFVNFVMFSENSTITEEPCRGIFRMCCLEKGVSSKTRKLSYRWQKAR